MDFDQFRMKKIDVTEGTLAGKMLVDVKAEKLLSLFLMKEINNYF
jgi:hypothetical protein